MDIEEVVDMLIVSLGSSDVLTDVVKVAVAVCETVHDSVRVALNEILSEGETVVEYSIDLDSLSVSESDEGIEVVAVFEGLNESLIEVSVEQVGEVVALEDSVGVAVWDNVKLCERDSDIVSALVTLFSDKVSEVIDSVDVRFNDPVELSLELESPDKVPKLCELLKVLELEEPLEMVGVPVELKVEEVLFDGVGFRLRVEAILPLALIASLFEAVRDVRFFVFDRLRE